MARPPGLYRLSRLLGRLGVVVAVVLLAYVALTVYSASQTRVGSGGGSTTATIVQNVVTITSTLELENRGFLPITGVSVTSVVYFPDGTLIGIASSPTVNIPPSTNASVPISISVPLVASAEAITLLTHSVHLPTETSANVTFGGILTVRVVDTSGYGWGAPFDGLNATAGTPAPQANGTVAVPMQITFTNRAAFDENGQFTYAIRSAGGAPCATGTLPVQVPQGQGYDQGFTAYLTPSCSPSGGSVSLTFTGGGLNVTLPTEPIP